jgi:NAD(P)-dependent dehydrogenase (short-subunit alcohol dehydrogenase family)
MIAIRSDRPAPLERKRVCLLTGAAGKLGTEFCRRHAERYEIVAVHRSRAPAVTSQEQRYVDPLDPSAELPDNAHPVFSVRADLTASGEIARVVELALARFDRIDVLVNAAAHWVMAPMVGSRALLESTQAQFEINTMIPLRLAIEVAERFWRDRPDENRARRRGVVNVSSISGLRVFPGLHQSVYSASKAALNYLSLHMAEEFGSFGVRVNALLPTSFPRIIPSERVADALAQLDADGSSGEIVVVDAQGERRIQLY